MRIIGGKYKGKIFNPPTNFKARPTTDFAKEGLFNVLQNNFHFENIDVLDLFSGTGSISYEFCSRNCKSLISVEKQKSNYIYINKKIQELGFAQATAIQSDVFKYLSRCRKQFDLIFADPPYDMPDINKIYELVFLNNLLTDTSFLVIEHSESNDFSNYKHFVMRKKYGKVCFSFFDPIK